MKLITFYLNPIHPCFSLRTWDPMREQNCTSEPRSGSEPLGPSTIKHEYILKALPWHILRNSIIYIILNFHLLTDTYNFSCKSPLLFSLGHFIFQPFIHDKVSILIKLSSLSIFGYYCIFFFFLRGEEHPANQM